MTLQRVLLICVIVGFIGCILPVLAANTGSGDVSIQDTSSATGTVTVVSGKPAFLVGWSYRKLHAIGGSPDGGLTNYPIKIQIFRDGTTTQSGNIIQMGTNVTSDYRDLRFTDTSGSSIPYWVQSMNTTMATVWVNVTSIPKTGTQIYVYYGNSSATSQSNGSAVFPFFDDFGVINSTWTSSGASVANSILTISSGGILSSTQTFGTNTTMVVNATISSTSYNVAGFQTDAAGYGAIFYGNYPSSSTINVMNRNPYPSQTSASIGAWTGYHTYEVARRSTSATIFSVDGNLATSLYQNVPTISTPLFLWAQSGTMIVDWIYVRPSTTNEPTSAGTTSIAEYNPVPPVASFSESPQVGLAPLLVQFLDTSFGNGIDWQWNFGDGSSNDTSQSPSHTFSTANNYTVILTVNNSAGNTSASNVVQALKPPNFLNGWQYRKLHTINGSSDRSLINYPIKIQIFRDGTTTQSGNIIQMGTNVTSDYRDLRFTDTSGSSIPYWVQSMNTTMATVWVNVTSIPKTGTQIYVYYGNSSATSQSNGSVVFPFFDDFGAINSTWTSSGASVANSILTISSGGILSSTQTFGTNTTMVVNATISSTSYNVAGFQTDAAGYGAIFYGNYPSSSTINVMNRNPYPSQTSASIGAWTGYHTYEVARRSTSATIFSVDGNLATSLYQNVPTISTPLFLWAQSGTMIVDWIYVRPSTTNEPTSAGTTSIAEYNPVPPVASFSESPQVGLAPLLVQFLDTSFGNGIDWQWNFGDGSSNDTSQSPSHTFSTANNYTVILTVNNSAGNTSASNVVQALKPPNFLNGWQYRKLHTINGSSDRSLINYPIKIQIFRDGTTTQSGNIIQMGTNVTSDYRDLRFTDTSGSSIPYWVQSMNTTMATVWVNVTSIPKTGTQIYVYYGNSSATSQSNGSVVFPFFDDFGAINSTWTSSGASVANSILTISSGGILSSTQTFGTNTTMVVNATISSTSYNVAGFQTDAAGYGAIFYGNYPSSSTINVMNRNPYPSQTSASIGAWTGYHTYEVARRSTSATIFSVDGNLATSLYQNVPTISTPLFLWAQSGTMTVDWIYVRPSTTNEPTSAGTTSIAEYNPVPPVASFSESPQVGLAPLLVRFLDTSFGNGIDWQWNFGDGSSNDTSQNPSHTFTTANNYTVILTTNNSAGNSSASNVVQAIAPPTFLNGWQYRKLHTINGSSDRSLINYPIKIQIFRDRTTTQSGNIIQMGTNVTSDYRDLRFTDTSESSIPYWVQSMNTTMATVWVNVTSIPKTGTQIYVYYGNSSATSQSNGSAVFPFFDDFGAINSTWTSSGASVANSILTISSGGILSSTQTFGTNTTMVVNATISSTSYNVAGFQTDAAGYGAIFYGNYPSSSTINVMNRNPYPSQTSASIGAWTGYHTYEVTRRSTSATIFSVDGNLATSLYQNVPTISTPLFLWAQSGTMTVDWIYVRPSTTNEPTSAGTTSIAEYNPVPPVASFSESPQVGLAPLLVQFLDTSFGNGIDWQWNFGDGSSNDTSQNPSHTFTTANNYTVILTTNNSAGNSSASNVVQAIAPPTFLNGWQYRKLHTINGSSDRSLINYPIKIQIFRDRTTTQSGNIIQMGTNVTSDYRDLRFTDTSESSIPYWVQSMNTTMATVWVNVTSIPKTGTQIYVYYGNSSATSQSNGSAVFPFFDDFGAINSTWTSSGASVANSILTISSGGILSSTQTFGTNTTMVVNATISSTSYNVAGFQTDAAGYGAIFYGNYPSSSTINVMNRNPYPSQTSASIGAWTGYHTYEVTRRSTSATIFSVDGNLATSLYQNVPTISTPLFLWAQSGTMTVDWIYVRPSTTNEPTSAGTGDS